MSAIGNDGATATECRSASKLLATITARDILESHYDIENDLDGLPLDFGVAYQHPSIGCEDIKIVFTSDMPHLIKKFRNAFDNKSRELRFRGKNMKLSMVEDVWRAMQSGGSEARTTILTCDHFHLNSYSKMRVFLAAQITSQSTIALIREYCNIAEHQAIDKIDE